MRFALTDDQRALREAVGALLQAECPPAVVRAAWPGGDRAPVDAVWGKLAEMGVLGAAVPESAGGLGLDARDLVPLLEETGRAALPLPIVETAFVAAPLLAAVGDPEGLLDPLLAGDLLVSCSLRGESLVGWGGVADVILLAAGGAGPVRLLRRDDGGAEPVASVDGARALVRLTDPDRARTICEDRSLLAAARRRGTLGTAAQLIGLARSLLDLTCDYVRERRQFGVAVGSFQAVKHNLADALLAVEFAAPAVLRAADTDARGGEHAERDVSMAKALASEAARGVAASALQCHGAIAYTVEHDLHLQLKRIWALAAAWGDAEHHRARVGAALGLPVAAA